MWNDRKWLQRASVCDTKYELKRIQKVKCMRCWSSLEVTCQNKPTKQYDVETRMLNPECDGCLLHKNKNLMIGWSIDSMLMVSLAISCLQCSLTIFSKSLVFATLRNSTTSFSENFNWRTFQNIYQHLVMSLLFFLSWSVCTKLRIYTHRIWTERFPVCVADGGETGKEKEATVSVNGRQWDSIKTKAKQWKSITF